MAKNVKQVPAKVANGNRPVAKAKTPTKAKVIHLLVKENPKQGKSHNRFAFYRDGMTVQRYIERCEAVGLPASLARADLRWDTKHQLIAIE
jgi:hypothetical protein